MKTKQLTNTEKAHILLNGEALKLYRLTIKKGKFYEDDVNSSYFGFIGKSITEKRETVTRLRGLNNPQYQEAIMKHVDWLISTGNYNLPLTN